MRFPFLNDTLIHSPCVMSSICSNCVLYFVLTITNQKQHFKIPVPPRNPHTSTRFYPAVCGPYAAEPPPNHATDCVTEKGSLVPVTTRKQRKRECLNNRDYIYISRRLYAALKKEHWIGSEYKQNGDYFGALSDLFHVQTAEHHGGTTVIAAAPTATPTPTTAASVPPSPTTAATPASAGPTDTAPVSLPASSAEPNTQVVASQLVSSVLKATPPQGTPRLPDTATKAKARTHPQTLKDRDFYVDRHDKYRRELLDGGGGYLESTLLFKKAVNLLEDVSATDITVILYKVKGKLGLGLVSPKVEASDPEEDHLHRLDGADVASVTSGVYIAKLEGKEGKTFAFVDGQKQRTCIGLQIIKIHNHSVEFERKEKAIKLLKSEAMKERTQIKLQLRVNRDGYRSCRSGGSRSTSKRRGYRHMHVDTRRSTTPTTPSHVDASRVSTSSLDSPHSDRNSPSSNDSRNQATPKATAGDERGVTSTTTSPLPFIGRLSVVCDEDQARGTTKGGEAAPYAMDAGAVSTDTPDVDSRTPQGTPTITAADEAAGYVEIQDSSQARAVPATPPRRARKWSRVRSGVVDKIVERNREAGKQEETAFEKLIRQAGAESRKKKKREEGDSVYHGKSTSFGKFRKTVTDMLSRKSSLIDRALSQKKKGEEERISQRIKARGTVKSTREYAGTSSQRESRRSIVGRLRRSSSQSRKPLPSTITNHESDLEDSTSSEGDQASSSSGSDSSSNDDSDADIAAIISGARSPGKAARFDATAHWKILQRKMGGSRTVSPNVNDGSPRANYVRFTSEDLSGRDDDDDDDGGGGDSDIDGNIAEVDVHNCDTTDTESGSDHDDEELATQRTSILGRVQEGKETEEELIVIDADWMGKDKGASSFEDKEMVDVDFLADHLNDAGSPGGQCNLRTLMMMHASFRVWSLRCSWVLVASAATPVKRRPAFCAHLADYIAGGR